ncbi:hypothetical protein CAC42_195 [Sphaceloma murrayae]|uniref:Uncharacterized protein n=1 Tax=Sphaceloma murrayae TaxID=2082308 RepID=A0A2K1QN78_9PEZI|nr:hypothetical protein CAC42_195 [Sphaceloma murrayae]
MKFLTFATLSLATLAFAVPDAQDEEFAPAPTGFPSFGAGSEAPDLDKLRSLLDSFRSRGGATGGAPFPRPTARPTRSRPGRPAPTGGLFPGLGERSLELAEGEAEDFFGAAFPTGRPGRGRRPRPSRGGGGVAPTGLFPGFPRPTGEGSEPEAGAAAATGRPRRPRPGRPTRRPRPTGVSDATDLDKRAFDEADESEERVPGAARPTGRPGRPGRPGRGPRPTGVFPGFPGFPRPTGGMPSFPLPTGGFFDGEGEESVGGAAFDGAAAPTGRPGHHGRRPRPTGTGSGRPRAGRPGRKPRPTGTS